MDNNNSSSKWRQPVWWILGGLVAFMFGLVMVELSDGGGFWGVLILAGFVSTVIGAAASLANAVNRR